MPNYAPYSPPNMDFTALASEERVQRAMAALEANFIAASVVDDAAAAKAAVLALLPEGANVFTAQSRTLIDSGLWAAIDDSGRYDAIRPKLKKLDYETERDQARRLISAPDFIVGSAHAVTEAGQVMAASGTGSQLGAYAGGAGKVILVVGTQKVVASLEEGLRRIREYSLPNESARVRAEVSRPSYIGKELIIERERAPGRITLIFVRQNLGF